MYESILSPLEELAKFLGLSISTLLIILGIVLAVGFGSFISLILGTRWGMALGLGPVILGVFLGLLPVWIVFVCAIPGMFVAFGSLFGRGLQTSELEEEEEDMEEEEEEEIEMIELPKPLPLKPSRFSRKPPWSK